MAELSAFPAGEPAVSAGLPSHSFDDSEGLRVLLIRLRDAGPGAWRCDREAADLFRFTSDKYRALARKYGLDPWEAVTAAFDAMLAESTVGARDPWAVVTRAVQVTLGAEMRARGLLIATDKARRPLRLAGFHDAIRFADRENLTAYHPAFAVTVITDDDTGMDGDDAARVPAAISDAVLLFVSHGWEPVTVRDAVEHVAYRVADFASSKSAVEALRRDRSLPALLGLPPRSWSALLRIVLGHPDRKHEGTVIGAGVLLRLLSGVPLDVLLADPDLTRAIRLANPKGTAS